MADTNGKRPLWAVRDELGLSRERVVRSPELDPPISAKTLERWEKGGTVKGYRLRQLAAIYGCKLTDLRDAQVIA